MSEFNPQHELDDELLSAYLDDELSAEERAAVEARLAADPAAEQLLHQLRAVAQAVQALPQESVGYDLRDAVLHKTAQHASTEQQAGTKTIAAASPTVSAPTLSIGRTRRGWVWASLAVAAALLVMMFDAGQQPEDDMPAVAKREAPTEGDRLPSQRRENGQVAFRALGESLSEPSNEPAPPAAGLQISAGDGLASGTPESRTSDFFAENGLTSAPAPAGAATALDGGARGMEALGTPLVQQNVPPADSFGVEFSEDTSASVPERPAMEPSTVPAASAPSPESLAAITPDLKLTREGVEMLRDAPELRQRTAAPEESAGIADGEAEQVAAGDLIVVRVVAKRAAIEGKAFDRLLESNGIEVEATTEVGRSVADLAKRRAAISNERVAPQDQVALQAEREVSSGIDQRGEAVRETAAVETGAGTQLAADALLVEAPREAIVRCLESLHNDTANYVALAVDDATTVNEAELPDGGVRFHYFHAPDDATGRKLSEELGWARYGRGRSTRSVDALARVKWHLSYGMDRDGGQVEPDRYAAGHEASGGRGGEVRLRATRQDIDARNADKGVVAGKARALRLSASGPAEPRPDAPTATRSGTLEGRVADETQRAQFGAMPQRLYGRPDSAGDLVPVLFVLTLDEEPAPSPASENRAE